MRILLCSRWFSPSFGGVETVSKALAEQWTIAGCEVVVVTDTPGDSSGACYKVVRRPSLRELLALGAWCHVVVQNIVSLRTLLPLAPARKPIVIIHGSWMRRSDGKLGWENYLKRLMVRRFHNVAISESIAESLGVSSITIGNPFESAEFTDSADHDRPLDIVFLGRLVSDKGIDLLLRAVRRLEDDNLRPSVTIVGDGPELGMLLKLTKELNLGERVTFTGAMREGRGQLVARHKMMVIPSRWAEPFGVVALEGIAAGCAIVASSNGGLMEAVGNCGVFFPNGDVEAMAAQIRRVLNDPLLHSELIKAGPEHLRNYQPAVVAAKYLDLFQRLIEASSAERLT